MNELLISPLTEADIKVSSDDLQFIGTITDVGKSLGYRIIIGGGYAVDGFLGKVTRPHNDIDIQVYATLPDSKTTVTSLLTQVGTQNSKFQSFQIEDKGRKEFFHNYLAHMLSNGADIDYLQTTTDPFATEKIIVKADGSLTPPHPFNTRAVTLKGVSYETQDPLTELADKIYKREFRKDPKQKKHDQDIANLSEFFTAEEVQKRVNQMRGVS